MSARIKTGGRSKNTPNKVTNELRSVYNLLLENNLDKMQSWLDAVGEDNPAKALDLMIKISEFVIPKLNRVEIREDDTTKNVTIPIDLWVNNPELASQISGVPKIDFIG